MMPNHRIFSMHDEKDVSSVDHNVEVDERSTTQLPRIAYVQSVITLTGYNFIKHKVFSISLV